MALAAGEHSVFLARLQQLRALLTQNGCDAVVLGSTKHETALSRWLCGVLCRSPQQYIVVTTEDIYFLEVAYRATDLRSQTDIRIVEVTDEDSFAPFLRDIVGTKRVVGVAGVVPWRDLKGIEPVKLRDLQDGISAELAIKSDVELREIRQLANDLKDILTRQLSLARAQGWSEEHLHRVLCCEFALAGGLEAFPTSIVSGARLEVGTVGAPSSRRISPSEPVLIDAGMTRRGLYSDLTIMAGDLPGSVIDRLSNAIHDVVHSLRVGTTLAELHSRLRERLTEESLPIDTLVKEDLGHGIGFSLHEAPLFVRPETGNFPLRNGLVFTIEPEIKVGQSWVRIERMVALENGRGTILA